MHLKPLSEKLFLLPCEQLLDLMSTPLKRLKETDALLHIQHAVRTYRLVKIDGFSSVPSP